MYSTGAEGAAASNILYTYAPSPYNPMEPGMMQQETEKEIGKSVVLQISNSCAC